MPRANYIISDNGNSVIRRVDGSGTITTYPIPTDFPEDLVVDPTGNIAVIDPEDETLLLFARTIPLGLGFDPQNMNTASAPQDVTVTNIGNEALDFAAIAPPTGFNLSGPDTSCSISSAVASGLDCILGVVFDPPTAGGFEEAVVLTDNSLGPTGASGAMQPVPVNGTGVALLTPTTTTLTAMPNPAIAGQTVTLTATVTPTPTGGTLGSVDFCLNGTGPDAIRNYPRTSARGNAGWPITRQARRTFPRAGRAHTWAPGTLAPTGLRLSRSAASRWEATTSHAVYSGTDTLATSTSVAVTVTIDCAPASTTKLTASPNPAMAGASVTLTATVSPTPTGEPSAG